MWFLTLLTYVALLVQFAVVTIVIAVLSVDLSLLYYWAELVEEYTNLSSTKKCVWWLNLVVTMVYVLLWLVENLPTTLIACGILAQLAQYVILIDFPYVKFLSPGFLAASLLLVVNHYLALQHFHAMKIYSVSEVLAYFTLCLWLVPFLLYTSLSVNDNELPTPVIRGAASDGDVVCNYLNKKNKKYARSDWEIILYRETLLPNGSPRVRLRRRRKFFGK